MTMTKVDGLPDKGCGLGECYHGNGQPGECACICHEQWTEPPEPARAEERAITECGYGTVRPPAAPQAGAGCDCLSLHVTIATLREQIAALEAERDKLQERLETAGKLADIANVALNIAEREGLAYGLGFVRGQAFATHEPGTAAETAEEAGP